MNKKLHLVAKTISLAVATICTSTAISAAEAEKESVIPAVQSTSTWYKDAKEKMAAKPSLAHTKKAKNVILFVGDGMGISTLTAARILEGQRAGKNGEENYLSFETFPFTGLSKTYNVDAQTPDSAGTMTAMMSGVKTDIGVIGVGENVERGVCATEADNDLVTALELAEIAGKSTGIVSTARITHATPAATYAKSVDRNWESSVPFDAMLDGCQDIASQLVDFEDNLKTRYPTASAVNGMEVIMGGGRRNFLPDTNPKSKRHDDRDLIAEWETKYPTGVYVADKAGFDRIIPNSTDKLFGLFSNSHMQYEADREADSVPSQPSLTEMTKKAIDVLDNNDKGFFLMVEAGRIDHAHHAGNAYGALSDTIELSNAVRAAVANTNPEDTLIIVTADHSHVFTIAGYPKRGNPILGKLVGVGQSKPSLDKNELPYTTVGYMNGRGFADLGSETDSDARYSLAIDTGRKDLTNVDTTAPGYHQEALVPLSSETHAGEDVGIFAKGPGAEKATGVNEQNVIYHMMVEGADLEKLAEDNL